MNDFLGAIKHNKVEVIIIVLILFFVIDFFVDAIKTHKK
jgi:uncharacterized Rmd1/YagE family protein